MDRPTCGTCPFWQGLLGSKDDEEPGSRTCRAHAPRIAFGQCDSDAAVTGVAALAVFPGTNEEEWCGEHPDFPAWVKWSRG